MCGIFGWVGQPREGLGHAFKVFADTLARTTERRGMHATGISAWFGGNKTTLAKGPVRASEFVKTDAWEKALKAKAVIGHCRYATHGKPERNENNHPFKSGKWTLIHNGIVREYADILKAEGVKLESECDSETILRVFAKGAKAGCGAAAGLQQWINAVKDAHADYAIALLEGTTGKVRLMRNQGRPCAVVKLPALGIIAFASTVEILKAAMNAATVEFPQLLDGADGWDTVEGRVYVLDPKSTEIQHEDVRYTRNKCAAVEPSGDDRLRSREPLITYTPAGREPGEDAEENDGGLDDVDLDDVNVCELCGDALDACRCEEETAPKRGN